MSRRILRSPWAAGSSLIVGGAGSLQEGRWYLQWSEYVEVAVAAELEVGWGICSTLRFKPSFNGLGSVGELANRFCI